MFRWHISQLFQGCVSVIVINMYVCSKVQIGCSESLPRKRFPAQVPGVPWVLGSQVHAIAYIEGGNRVFASPPVMCLFPQHINTESTDTCKYFHTHIITARIGQDSHKLEACDGRDKRSLTPSRRRVREKSRRPGSTPLPIDKMLDCSTNSKKHDYLIFAGFRHVFAVHREQKEQRKPENCGSKS